MTVVMRGLAFLCLLAVVLYAVLSWYFFGSPHPCGILEARKKPYRIKLEREAAFAIERKHSQEGERTQFRDLEILKLLEEDRKRNDEAPEAATRKLHEEVAKLSIVECASQAISWQSPD